MARDEHLLHNPAVSAALRLYGWDPPTISLGYFQRFATVRELPEEVRDLPVVRRQTGGGAILHDQEVTYCLVVDGALPIAQQSPDKLYRLAHHAWADALGADGVPVEMAPDEYPMPSPRTGPFFCFEKPGRTDLTIDGVKLLGSAQRRLLQRERDAATGAQPSKSAAGRVLQHGSLLLDQRFAAHPGCALGAPTADTVARWTQSFITRVAEQLELDASPANWTAAQLADVDQRRKRYAETAWTELR